MLGYRVPAPDQAMLISGGKQKEGTTFKVVIGHGAWVMPGFRKVRFLGLDLHTVEIEESCRSNEGIMLNLKAVAAFKVQSDVNSVNAAAQRDDDSGVTLSGLLNTLDGIATPHGLFTVLTTNTPEVLDEAVVRPGRVDLVEHFSFADSDQVGRLLTRWYGKPIPIPRVLTRISAAEVVEVCKRHEDPAAAVAELYKATA